MKIKTFYGWTEKGMDKKVNEFLAAVPSINVVDIKFGSPLFFLVRWSYTRKSFHHLNKWKIGGPLLWRKKLSS
ncbi:sporulation protein Cse60 [Peribacillus sp. NPDC097197]|uniref:sporulation protein Cse60 n=1 Tax=Peribacillus sp. NPDC097197 TaxID=3390615 RepID=UPI003D048DAE